MPFGFWPYWRKPVVVIAIVATGSLVLPLCVPLIPIERYSAYEEWLGIRAPQEEVGHTGPIPQHFADRFGWREMTETVAEVYWSLPSTDRPRCAVFTQNHGEAGALEFHGRKYGLPPVLSGHNNYWLWGYGDFTGEVLITVGIPQDDLESAYEQIELAATHTHPFAVPEERDVPIYVCRKPKISIQRAWPQVKHFI